LQRLPEVHEGVSLVHEINVWLPKLLLKGLPQMFWKMWQEDGM
jgi:hypothetical protein